MHDAFNIYFVGTAGCGKSTMTAAFSEWLNGQGYDSLLVNLDPGAETVPYEPDIDIRDWIKLSDIMREYGLGPNGAQVAAADLLALNAPEVVRTVEGYDTDYLLIDTPGQLELFTFRESSKRILESFGEQQSMIAFLIDPMLARNPNGFVSSLLLAATTSFRMGAATLTMVSKSDLLTEEDIERIKGWSADSMALFDALSEGTITAQNQASLEFLKALETMGVGKDIRFASSETMFGLEEIYDTAQRISAGGEDLTPR